MAFVGMGAVLVENELIYVMIVNIIIFVDIILNK